MTANLTALVARLREYADSGDSPVSVSACMHSAADAIEAKDRALKAFVDAEDAWKREAFDTETMDDPLSDAYKLARQALGGSDDN